MGQPNPSLHTEEPGNSHRRLYENKQFDFLAQIIQQIEKTIKTKTINLCSYFHNGFISAMIDNYYPFRIFIKSTVVEYVSLQIIDEFPISNNQWAISKDEMDQPDE